MIYRNIVFFYKSELPLEITVSSLIQVIYVAKSLRIIHSSSLRIFRQNNDFFRKSVKFKSRGGNGPPAPRPLRPYLALSVMIQIKSCAADPHDPLHGFDEILVSFQPKYYLLFKIINNWEMLVNGDVYSEAYFTKFISLNNRESDAHPTRNQNYIYFCFLHPKKRYDKSLQTI